MTNTPKISEQSPRFSPDGRRLVYVSHSSLCNALAVANSDGTHPRRMGAGCNVSGASWSPNSRRLLVEITGFSREEIWTMTVDGSSKRFIVAGEYASWRPR